MDAIHELRSALGLMPELRLAVMFGSTAGGTAHEASDVDIGISLYPGAPLVPMLGVVLARAIGRPVDIVWLDEAPPLLRFEIARTGLVLVERDPHGWADFRAHAMIDWWDWAPTARLAHAAMTTRLRAEVRHSAA